MTDFTKEEIEEIAQNDEWAAAEVRKLYSGDDAATVAKFEAGARRLDIRVTALRAFANSMDAEPGAPESLTRPIIGIENRAAGEVFAIMADRIRSHFKARTPPASAPAEPVAAKALSCFDEFRAAYADPRLDCAANRAIVSALDNLRPRRERDIRSALAEQSKPTSPLHISALRSALEPFADIGRLICAETEGYEDDDLISLALGGYDLPHLAIGTFRKADAAINGIPRRPGASPNIHRCFICAEPFRRGEMVLPDIDEGLGHRACYGEDRDGYVKDIDTGEPLGPDDPIPAGEPYDPADYPESLALEPAPAEARAAVQDSSINAARVLILRERLRQIEVEGWTADHDDEHEDGHLLRVAGIYLWHGTDKEAPIQKDGTPLSWPWDARWWKPKSRQRNLERAGALCLAERSRRIRLGSYVGHVDQKLAIVERELAALLAAAPQPASRRVRHKKRGSTYRVIGEAEAQLAKPSDGVFTPDAWRPLREGSRLTVYQAEHDGKLWARFSDEFEDGRFEDLHPSQNGET
ncbi:hypothetical protein [Kaistia algarum]|uniref:hypothetical protein n=1 Tax=Kaistia algarum TaxID=2083279 RepID=UPI001A9C6D46|nr:hypothetical protein [Kaistia algarum]MCX5516177.1 hypothetical protein [Kaistia algarum]